MRVIKIIVFLIVSCTIATAQELNKNMNSKNISAVNDIPFPEFPDIFYEYRIAELNKTTPVELEYNQEVLKYIKIFSIQRREDFARIIGLSHLYFPYFDEILARHNLPLELKYLTIVESGLNPLAVSKSGAVGLWQFLLNTCRLFDLEVNSYIDERRDLFKSTDAACRYLQYLYNTFNDWQLVLSSYNGGPGDVRKAIERSNGKIAYRQLRPYLSEQAQNYVPAFVAAFYLMTHYKEHNIVPVPSAYQYFELDTVRIGYEITFRQISEIIDIPAETLRYLNPVYKIDIIPDMQNHAVLVLPKDKVLEFIRYESRMLGTNADKENYFTMVNSANFNDDKIKIIHTVEKGEFYHKIAIRYNCTLENIKTWNNLTDNSISPGQKLVIWVDKSFYKRN